MLIGSLALMGFPFLTGFYSKDTILEVAYAKYTIWGHFSYYLGTFAAFFTAFYSIRLLFLVFLAEPNGNKNTLLNAHEGSWRMGFPLFILSLLSISVGFLTRDLFIGFGTNFWGASIFVLPQNYVLSDIEFIDLFHKLLPLMISILGASSAYFLYSFGLNSFYNIKKTSTFKFVYNFLNRKWYFDRIYNQLIGQNALSISYHYSYKDIDRGIIEILGPSGIVKSVQSTYNSLNLLQSGFVYHYLFLFLISVLFLAFLSISFSNLWLSLNMMFFLFLSLILI
jgi:NADH-ubiquinone oxidoreductase chain 5